MPNACESCRVKKVKCDKINPCTNCTRTSTRCIFLERPSTVRGRAGGRKPQAKDLREKVTRLESVINSLRDSVQLQSTSNSLQVNTLASQLDPVWNSIIPTGSHDSTARTLLGANFWTMLENELNDLRDFGYDDSESDLSDDDRNVGARPSDEHSNASPMLHVLALGKRHTLKSMTIGQVSYPTDHLRMNLVEIYLRNVDPIMKVIHTSQLRIPTSTSSSHAQSALLFSVYAAAVMSLSEADCKREFNVDRDDLMREYLNTAQLFLIEADFLDSQNLAVIQAFTIYLIVLRAIDHGQRHWALMGLLIRLAHGMGLHRAESYKNLSVFEQEMRRRVWHQLRVVELRAALDRGEKPEIDESSHNIPAILNIDDEDLREDAFSLPAPRQRITNCTFSILSHECIVMCKRLAQPIFATMSETKELQWHQKAQLIAQFEHRIHTTISPFCDLNVPLQWYIQEVWVGLLPMFKLMLYRPIWQHVAGQIQPPASHDEILSLAIASLTSEEVQCFSPIARDYSWHLWVQWYTLAVALAELGSRPLTDIPQGTWDLVERSFVHQSRHIADSHRGRLWKPIKKLMKRAWASKDLHDQIFSQEYLPSSLATVSTSQHNLESSVDVNMGGSNGIQPTVQPKPAVPQTTMDDAWAYWETFMKDLSDA